MGFLAGCLKLSGKCQHAWSFWQTWTFWKTNMVFSSLVQLVMKWAEVPSPHLVSWEGMNGNFQCTCQQGFCGAFSFHLLKLTEEIQDKEGNSAPTTSDATCCHRIWPQLGWISCSWKAIHLLISQVGYVKWAVYGLCSWVAYLWISDTAGCIAVNRVGCGKGLFFWRYLYTSAPCPAAN